jgi:hypothetical protein
MGATRGRSVIPGSSKLDEGAALILAQMLKRRGIGAAAETADALSMARFFSLDLSQAAAFCICYIGKPSDAMIQYTVRRLSKKTKGGRIIVRCSETKAAPLRRERSISASSSAVLAAWRSSLPRQPSKIPAQWQRQSPRPGRFPLPQSIDPITR